MRIFIILLIFIGSNLASCQNQMEWEGHTVKAVNVTVMEIELEGEDVLRAERDLEALPFDPDNIIKTVDEPTFAKITR